jgi:hypothetical protein
MLLKIGLNMMVLKMKRITRITDEVRDKCKMFRVWLNQREINISSALFTLSKFVCSNNVGAVVHYTKDQEKELDENPEMIGGFLAWRHPVYDIVFAKDVDEAIKIVKKDHDEGMNIGGDERPEQKAQWLTGRVDVMSMICKDLNVNPEGIFICGELNLHSGSGEFGGCWLSGADSIESCEGEWIIDITNPASPLVTA